MLPERRRKEPVRAFYCAHKDPSLIVSCGHTREQISGIELVRRYNCSLNKLACSINHIADGISLCTGQATMQAVGLGNERNAMLPA